MRYKFFKKFIATLPFVIVVVIALVIAIQNIKINTYFSGWDNIHAEFNLSQYAERVFFGAWQEHQGLGGPAAKGHLAEVPRLPILYILTLIFPENLIRYVFVFIMYLVGGVGTYLYLDKYWLKKDLKYRSWVASVSAVFYLLHVLSLQQFYIAFEMFTVQFAFLPFLLISIHKLVDDFNLKTVFYFLLVQLLIAPSAHTSTVFYLGALFSFVYSFFYVWQKKKKLINAIESVLVIGALTVFVNAFWLVPNLKYLFNNSQYVTESVANRLFGPESLWSIRDAGNTQNFLSGMHYLFSWKDYSFKNNQHEYIFSEWLDHLSSPIVIFLMNVLGVFVVLGVVFLIFGFKKEMKKWGVILTMLGATFMIWIGFLVPDFIVDFLYQSKSILEALRNPFTKFSVLYSFVLIIALSYFLEFVFLKIKIFESLALRKTLPIFLLNFVFFSSIYISLPSFTGNFLNEKLMIIYPNEYQEMFEYMKTRDKNERVLELPFYSNVGWVFYDWITLGKKYNGYQGIGFYFFGFPQSFLTPDFARWQESNDFFYSELKNSLDDRNADQFENVTSKYRVDLVIVDETQVNIYSDYNYDIDHEILKKSGFKKVWEKNFLSIYENQRAIIEKEFIAPEQTTFISADLDRVKRDYVYENMGSYINSDKNDLEFISIYPFTELLSEKNKNIFFKNNQVSFEKDLPDGDYVLEIPAFIDDKYTTTAEISYVENSINISFPNIDIQIGDEAFHLPQLKRKEIFVEESKLSAIIWINQRGYVINKGETIYPTLNISTENPIVISYLGFEEFIMKSDLDDIIFELSSEEIKETIDVPWDDWKKPIKIETKNPKSIKFIQTFPFFVANLFISGTENCSQPRRGVIDTQYEKDGIIYFADDFAVNCASYYFEYISPSNSYLLHISGENYQGRSIKLFSHFLNLNALTDSYLLSEGYFDLIASLNQIADTSNSRHVFNWETRSFGKESKNKLSKFEIVPLPIEKLSQIKLKKSEEEKIDNVLNYQKIRSKNSVYYLADYFCQSKKCYLGINQSYDDFWLAINTKTKKILPHFKFNNWANIWEVSGEGQILIYYVPEIISLLLMGILGVSLIVILVILTLKIFRKK